MLEYSKRYIKSITSKEILQATWGLKKKKDEDKAWLKVVQGKVEATGLWRQ